VELQFGLTVRNPPTLTMLSLRPPVPSNEKGGRLQLGRSCAGYGPVLLLGDKHVQDIFVQECDGLLSLLQSRPA
jgi:hypothetical protein